MFTRISNFQAKCYKIYQGEELKLKLKCDCVCGQSLTPSGQHLPAKDFDISTNS